MNFNKQDLLKFDTDSKKFDSDNYDDMYDDFSQKVNIDFTFNYNLDEMEICDDIIITSEIIEKPFGQFYYNNNIIKFKNKEEIEQFVSSYVKKDDVYYLLDIPQKNHIITVKMRSLEAIVEYIIKYLK
jgi:hypothetical protein